MSGKVILVLLTFLVWSVISWRWYTCGVKGFCGGSDAVAASVDDESNAADAKTNPL